MIKVDEPTYRHTVYRLMNDIKASVSCHHLAGETSRRHGRCNTLWAGSPGYSPLIGCERFAAPYPVEYFLSPNNALSPVTPSQQCLDAIDRTRAVFRSSGLIEVPDHYVAYYVHYCDSHRTKLGREVLYSTTQGCSQRVIWGSEYGFAMQYTPTRVDVAGSRFPISDMPPRYDLFGWGDRVVDIARRHLGEASDEYLCLWLMDMRNRDQLDRHMSDILLCKLTGPECRIAIDREYTCYVYIDADNQVTHKYHPPVRPSGGIYIRYDINMEKIEVHHQ